MPCNITAAYEIVLKHRKELWDVIAYNTAEDVLIDLAILKMKQEKEWNTFIGNVMEEWQDR
jgi:hypothetical protein